MVGTAIGLKLSIKFPRQLEQIRFVASAPDNLQAQRHPRIIHAHRQADRRQVRDIGKASVICLIGRCILAMRESALWRSRQDDGSVFGDDIRWAPRPDCVNLAGISFDEMLVGEKPEGPLFPLLWSDDGRRDGDADYPRGFSTTWPQREMQGVNEYAKFKELEGKEKTGALSARDRSPVN
jgi:hypothetical protein